MMVTNVTAALEASVTAMVVKLHPLKTRGHGLHLQLLLSDETLNLGPMTIFQDKLLTRT